MVALCPGGLRRYPRQRPRPAPQIAAPVHAIIRRMTNCGTPFYRVTIESYRSTCRPLAAHSDKAKVATTVDLARDLVSLSRRRSRILCPIRTALRPLSDQTNKRTVPSVIEMRQLAAGLHCPFPMTDGCHPLISSANAGEWCFRNSVKIDRAIPFARTAVRASADLEQPRRLRQE
jgi:hypothetical protein